MAVVDHAGMERYPATLSPFGAWAILDHDQHGGIHHAARRDLQPHFQYRAEDLPALSIAWLYHLGLHFPDDLRELHFLPGK